MRTFRSIIARESVETDEGWLTRVFPTGCFEWGDGPWPVTVMHEDMALNGTCLGRADRIERLGDLILAYGVLDDEGSGEAADLRRDLIRQIDAEMVNAISVEPAGLDVEEECVSTDDDGFCDDLRVTFTRYRIGVMSLVTIPAIDGTLIELDPVGTEEPVVADEPAATVAAMTDEWTIPAAWLTEPADLPDLDEPGSRVPIVTADGHVYGYLASWSDCHTSFADYCQTPWRSPTGYAYAMHSGPFRTDDGNHVTLAPMAASGGHYSTVGAAARDWRAAQRHYDDPDTCAAYVAFGENDHGIWFSGALRPDAPERLVNLLRRHQLSGDWRRPFGEWELMGACSVNQPGFVRRAAWAASAEGGMELVAAVVASGGSRPTPAACECGGTCDSCAHPVVMATAAAGTLDEALRLIRDIHAASVAGTEPAAGDGPLLLETRLAGLEAHLQVLSEFLEPQVREALRARLVG